MIKLVILGTTNIKDCDGDNEKYFDAESYGLYYL
jgi:hypothetical protein